MRDNKVFKAKRSVACFGLDAAVAREVSKIVKTRKIDVAHVVVCDPAKVDYETLKTWGRHCVENGEGVVIVHCFDKDSRRLVKKQLRGSMDGKRFHTVVDRSGFALKQAPNKKVSFKRNLVTVTEYDDAGVEIEEQTIIYQS